MSGNRQKATAFILENLEAILPGNADTPRYKKYLESLTDEAFAISEQAYEDFKR